MNEEDKACIGATLAREGEATGEAAGEPPLAAVIGLGRFGTFWAGMMAEHYRVVGTSRRPVAPLPPGVRQVPLEEALAAPVIFLTVAISAMPGVLRSIAPLLKPGTVVVDTCSVKVYPVRQMEALLPDSVDIIASHPMFGPDSARERQDPLPVILWPVRDRQGRYGELRSVFEGLGLRVVEMSPEEHDQEAAFTQGVTHLVGRVLRAMDLQPSDISTLGYRRLLQVMEQTCNDPLELFRDLQRFNPSTRAMREAFSRAFGQVEELLAPDARPPQGQDQGHDGASEQERPGRDGGELPRQGSS
ncbi:prephenate dehydrogenase/arogenate dehydrogenase family protein [Alkalispirochaeta alkalica]|uniref:prephenate dehydrogenase/arogenate dehydrogenase family protein n=1 Tax=Alkalispirochaeta alkalica TaxID=46356 RepID=UPI000368999F|nr:prephenate dehydrogenase/arogenate dehydrogenase family protein [Alkalispirochaeta alkalica]